MSDCTGLIVSDYIFTRVLCLVSSTVLGFIFHICFVSFIVIVKIVDTLSDVTKLAGVVTLAKLINVVTRQPCISR